MATIRVRDWTKARIEEIREAESHSSHDSVIKSLLKDRELAEFARTEVPESEPTTEPASPPADTAFDDLTVLAELTEVENGVLFLWCPNCVSEVAHLTVEDALSVSVFEIECQRCLTHLDQHALVGIEIGYPLEHRLVEGTLADDLQACVIDYWDRTLHRSDGGRTPVDADPADFVWRLGQYAREFDWDWPEDVPVVGIEAGRRYRHEPTDEFVAVLEPATEHRNALDAYRVRRYPPGTDDPETVDSEVLEAGTIKNILINRELILAPADGESGSS